MPLSARWTFLALLLFLNTARSYGFENVTIDEEMLWANLVERGATNSKSENHESHLHIVAIGDVHGNLDNLKKVLYMAGVTDAAGNWEKSGPTDTRQKWEQPPDFLVQVGDIMDRGDQVKDVFEFFDKLRKKAPGKVFTLLGNHEWMNLLGDWRMVNEEELKKYKNNHPRRYRDIHTGKIGSSLKDHFIAALRLPLHPLAGKPNQPYDPEKAKSPLSDAALAFVHAGFSTEYPGLLVRFPETINKASSSLLEIVQNKKPNIKLKPNQEALLDQDGPFWYRGWAKKPEEEVCSEVDTVLKDIGARIVIVGHTTTHSNTIEFKCDKKLIFTDTNMRKGYLAALSIEYLVSRVGGQWVGETTIRVITPPDEGSDKKAQVSKLIVIQEHHKAV